MCDDDVNDVGAQPVAALKAVLSEDDKAALDELDSDASYRKADIDKSKICDKCKYCKVTSLVSSEGIYQ